MAKLCLVPTPIGNLEDITLRSIRILKEADIIFAEDTRVTKKLLNHLEISAHVLPFHSHNEHKALSSTIDKIKSCTLAVLVSDAGTPGISDPGFLLARECVSEGIEVECLPGPTAFVPALVASGFPCDRFCFEGFLPHKKGRQTKLLAIEQEERTTILYESPHRLVKCLVGSPDEKAYSRLGAYAKNIGLETADLIVIDGGKGHYNVARKILDELDHKKLKFF